MLRPPGRPLESGLYSRRPQVRVDQLVEDFRARQVDLDCTDEDMLYLRAYLAELRERSPSLSQLEEPVTNLLSLLQARASASSESPGCGAAAPAELLASITEVRLLLSQLVGYTSQLEQRHARIIVLSKVRAETRIKNHAARQLDVFTLMVRRLATILEEQLAPQDFEAFQRRLEKEFEVLPRGLVEGSSSVRWNP
ncbi:hypothetical protein [Deinococcus aerophilus]|uniref:hypothetical protein n=1 Tax=Deinococcus aerophilus TaxID=522488 RepID=UPI00166C6A08|nr:hypothetical protein [Deinococcus aerophilus]